MGCSDFFKTSFICPPGEKGDDGDSINYYSTCDVTGNDQVCDLDADTFNEIVFSDIWTGVTIQLDVENVMPVGTVVSLSSAEEVTVSFVSGVDVWATTSGWLSMFNKTLSAGEVFTYKKISTPTRATETSWIRLTS